MSMQDFSMPVSTNLRHSSKKLELAQLSWFALPYTESKEGSTVQAAKKGAGGPVEATLHTNGLCRSH
jgi:hypothetical protein